MADELEATEIGRGPGEENQLEHVGRVVRERWWVVLTVVIAFTGAAAAMAIVSEKQYESSSSLLFRNPGLSSAVAGATLFESSSDPQRDTATNVELVGSTVVADQVVEQLGLDFSAEELLDRVTIAADENSDIVSITATEPDPEEAATIANGFAEQYVSYRRQTDRQKVEEGQRLVRNRIEDLPAGADAERADLEDALRTLVLLESVQTGNAEVIGVATPADSPSSPKPARDIILGLLFGLVVGISLAMLLDLLDRRVKDVDDFERFYGLRVLATVPAQAFRAGGSATADEAYGILRSRIDLRASWQPTATVLVTSARPGEGKTSVAANLSRALATGGQSVVLVEADMRRPSLSEHFETAGPTGGLRVALTGQVDERTGRRSHPTDLAALLAPTSIPNLRILPSGRTPPNPSDLLRTLRMGQLLAELRGLADMVIIDSPPLLPVADPQTLLALPPVDGFIAVARAYLTTRQDISRARKILEPFSAKALGLVVCGTSERLDYYNSYRSQPGSDEVEAVPMPR